MQEYTEQIRLALNNFDDPEWLGSESPLAAPYFLGDWIPPDTRTPERRGQALQQALLRAADRLWGEEPPQEKETLEEAVNKERRELGNKGMRYAYMLLELRYFRRIIPAHFFPRQDREVDIREFVGVGRGPFFNHLKQARQALGDALLELTRPALRLERPFQLRHPLVGRDQLQERIMTQLQAGDAVALSGPSGLGKSSLAAAVAHRWEGAVFWYTLRPTINDPVDSLLFALGAFCHQHGASNLWRQLIADGGQIANRSAALSQLHADLHQLPQPPLLCFDELDALQTTPEEMNDMQKAWIELLDGLRGHSALLLIGQQRMVTADHAYELEGLPALEVARLLQAAGSQFPAAEVNALHEYTGGNPRLLQLCLTLLEERSSITALITQLPVQPILHLIFERLWQRLTVRERETAQQLAVFAAPAPADGWPAAAQAALDRLVAQQLAQIDPQGGVALLPLYRDLIYNDRQRLPAETADNCHLQAAVWRAERAEFTAAARHLIAAGEEETAVALWFDARERETRSGQGPAALQLFDQLSQRRLSAESGEQLGLIRAELYDLLGRPADGLRELGQHRWKSDERRRIEAGRLKGKLQFESGAVDEALTTYEESFLHVSRLLNEQAYLRHLRGMVFLRERALNEAWQEALEAHYHARRLMAGVLDEKGEFGAAIAQYLAALEIAGQLNDPAIAARIENDLAIACARQGDHEAALRHGETAVALYAQIGDRFSLEKINNFLTALYLNMGEFAKVVIIGEQALHYFSDAKLEYWASMTAANLAEAYYEMGDDAKAEARARQVLTLEEAHSYPYALYTMGLIRRRQGEPAESMEWLERARQTAQENHDPYLEAYVWRALGESRAADGERGAAREAYGKALELFREMGINAEAEKTELLLAEVETRPAAG